LGQDGLRLNKSLLSPTNNTLPQNILQAMYNFSDQLPVVCNFEVKTTTKIGEYSTFFVNVENPVKNELFMQIYAEKEKVLNFEVFSLEGKRIDYFTEHIYAGNNNLSRKFDFPQSFYFLKITNEQGESVIKKLIK
jgi:hypothetical protein